MTKHERVALDFFLSDYPPNLSFNEIIELIENENGLVYIWNPFEIYNKNDIVELIKEKVDTLENTFE